MIGGLINRDTATWFNKGTGGRVSGTWDKGTVLWDMGQGDGSLVSFP